MNKLQSIYLPKEEGTLFVCGVVQGEFSHITDVEYKKAYVFTPEELKTLLEEYTNRIIENTETSWVSDGDSTGMWEDVIDEESITSQLSKFLKKLGI